MAEEVLISVKIDRQGNQNELQRLTGQIIAQKNEIKQLETAVKTLSKAEGDNTELIKKTTANLELKKQQLNQNVASQKALVNVVNAEVKSLNALRAENAQLIRQRNQLNTETAEGRSQIQAINAQIDANNAKIAENSSKLEQQKISINNYASALSGISPGIAGFINGLQGMVTAAKAFIATPLGLALAAIGLLAAPVISFFKDTAVGADLAAREVEGFDFVITRFKDKINQLGGELARGEGATNKFIEVQTKFIKLLAAPLLLPLQGAINKYKELAAAGQEYADTLDDLEDKQKSFSVVEAETENQIKRLALQSKNRTTSEKERVDLIDRALALEAQLQLKRKGFAEDELSALLRLNKVRLDSVGIIQQEGETQLDFAKRAADAIRETTLSGGDELADSFISAIKKLAEVEAQSIAIEEKLQNQRDALLDKQAEKDAKRREEAEKQREKDREIENKYYEEYVKEQADARKKEEEERIEQNRIEAEQMKNSIAIVKATADKKDKILKEQIKKATGYAEQYSNLLGDIFTAFLTGNNKAAKELTKRFAVTILDILGRQLSAQAIADSIAKFGPIAGAIRGAIAGGLIQGVIGVAKTAIMSFSRGGIAKTGAVAQGPSHAHGGIPFTVAGRPGYEMEGGEIIINKVSSQKYRRELSRINEAGGGVRFASGGIVSENATRVAVSNAQAQLDINQMARLINQVQTVLVLEDFEAKKLQVDGINNRATVIG